MYIFQSNKVYLIIFKYVFRILRVKCRTVQYIQSPSDLFRVKHNTSIVSHEAKNGQWIHCKLGSQSHQMELLSIAIRNGSHISQFKGNNRHCKTQPPSWTTSIRAPAFYAKQEYKSVYTIYRIENEISLSPKENTYPENSENTRIPYTSRSLLLRNEFFWSSYWDSFPVYGDCLSSFISVLNWSVFTWS